MSRLEPLKKPETTVSGARPLTRAHFVSNGDEDLIAQFREAGIQIVGAGDDPQIVITYGGDGTLLGADRLYPDLPKLPIRRCADVLRCERHEPKALIDRLVHGLQEVHHLERLQADVKGRRILAVNDIVFHNERAASAVRYRVCIDGEPYSGEVVGDGLVIATPFGSSGYYRSITESVFRIGIGIAFNNSTEAIQHLVLHPDSEVKVEVVRGPGIVFGDNDPEIARVCEGDTFTIQLATSTAEIWELSTLSCRRCIERRTGRPAGARHV